MGHVNYVREMANHDRMNVNALDKFGVTALIWASFEGVCNVVFVNN